MAAVLAPHWWALALRGLLGVLFGIACLVVPGFVFDLLIVFFGAYMLVDGIFAVVAVLFGEGQAGHWWALLIEGILGILVGLITFVWPAMTVAVVLYFIAAWAIVTGIFEILAAFRMRRHIKGEWALIVGGILSVIFGILVIVWPLKMVSAIIFVIGVYALFFGILLIILAFRLRKLAGPAPPLTSP
jgi:uncharacterized membrane protein HdeD (DUF308 family)